MATNWSIEHEQEAVEYEAGQVVCGQCGWVGNINAVWSDEFDVPLCPECGRLIEFADDSILEDCPLDGDAESALASAGFGTDEDYGYYGGDEW